MPYRAVIFDLGGVVLASPFAVFADHERRHGLAAGTVLRVIVAGGADGPWGRLERGQIDYDAFCAALDRDARSAGIELATHELMTRVGAETEVVPEMLAAVRRVRAGGRAVAALTNNWFAPDPLGARMEALHPEFDVFVESCREGVNKPDPRIYAIALERLGVAGPDAIFLDDLGQNLKPARALGMATIKVDSPAQAIAELEQLLG